MISFVMWWPGVYSYHKLGRIQEILVGGLNKGEAIMVGTTCRRGVGKGGGTPTFSVEEKWNSDNP